MRGSIFPMAIVLRVILILMSITAYAHTAYAKKKIIVFASRGGGAHVSAARAIKEFLEPRYEVQISNPLTEITHSIDPVLRLSNGYCSCEDWFNALNRTESMNSIRMLCEIGGLLGGITHARLTQLFEDFLKQEAPDAIISVMPFINGPLYDLAQKYSLPFLVVSPEFDTTNYCKGLYNTTYHKFFYCLPLDTPAVRAKFEYSKIPDDRIRQVGFPIRGEFLQKNHDVGALKQEFGLTLDVPVVCVMMGGGGSRALMRYARRLAKMDFPVQVIFCVGKNEAIRSDIENVERPQHITFITVGFTNRVSDYMAVSDVLIAKPGPTAMVEALYSNLPIIFDRTYKVMYTEYINIDFVEDNGLGKVLRSMRKLKKTLRMFLYDTVYQQQVKESISALRLPDFETHITDVVEHMFTLPDTIPGKSEDLP